MPAKAPHIVVVDDDPQIRTLLRRCFESEGYQVSEAANGASLLELLKAHPVDLVTLDLTLGSESGLEVARLVRGQSQVPLIMVTGKGDMVDRVVGLEVGADDYISKPFHVREVLARVRSVLRRSTSQNAQPESRQPSTEEAGYRFSGWRLDIAKRELRAPDGTLRPLTTAEFDLLALFAKGPNRVFSRDALMEGLKGHNWAANDRAIDTQVARLRKKIEADEGEPKLIKTIRGVGYIFTPDVSQRIS